ncbi:peptidyl-tRNA hydrolase, partial [Candidatus Actinomarina sp. HD9-500m-PIT-SAG01]
RPPSTVDPADYVLSKFNNDETEEVEFIIEDSMEIIDSFLENSENGIKKASERRIIDVI